MSWFRCKQCDKLADQVSILERALYNTAHQESQKTHSAELRAIKAETLAEAYRLEIERMDRQNFRMNAPPEGGFMPMAPEPEKTLDASEPIDDFQVRLAELFGVDGLPLSEIERRHNEFRRRELQTLQKEKDEISAELRELEGT